MMTVFLIRLAIHVISLLILMRWLFYLRYRDREFAFSAFMLGNVVFLATFFLKGVTLSMGFAFGLFAIFSILRYRTETISMSQMTFLFIGIGIAMLNAAAQLDWPYMAGLNGLVLGLLAFSLSAWFFPGERYQQVLYDRIDWITPDKRDLLLADLSARTGLDIYRVEVETMDFLRDTVLINAYYR